MEKLAIETRSSGQFGAFEVFMQGERIYSKMQNKRLPHPGEVAQSVTERLMRQ